MKYNANNTQVVVVNPRTNQITLLKDYNKSQRREVYFGIIDKFGNIVSELTLVKLRKWKSGDKRIKGEILSGKFIGIEVECNVEWFEKGKAYKLLGFNGTANNISNACNVKLLPGYGIPTENIREMIINIISTLSDELIYEVYLYANSLKKNQGGK